MAERQESREEARITVPRWAWKVLGLVAGVFLVVGLLSLFVSRVSMPSISLGGIRASPAVEEFTLNAGEEMLTVLVGPDTFHRIRANKPWVAVVRTAGKEYQMPAGFSSWQGGKPQGLLRVRGGANDTTLRFERVR